MSQAAFEQASQLHKAGKLGEAEKIYRTLISEGGEHPVLLARLGTVLQQQKRPHEALSPLMAARAAYPEDAKLLEQCIELAIQIGELDQAELCLREKLKLSPDDSSVKEQLAGLLLSQANEENALTLLAEVIKANPQQASAYNLKGMALCRLGDLEKGYKAFQKSLKLSPSQLGTVKNLILYGKGRKEPLLEQVIPQFEQQYRSASLSPIQKMNVAYVLFSYFEKRNPKKAFSYLKSGNDINRKSYQYNRADTEMLFNQLTALFTPDLVSKLKALELSSLKSTPIFILGMPRSGTTLVEQILGSHSAVTAKGELPDLRLSFEKYGEKLLDQQLSESEKIQLCKGVVESYLESATKGVESQFYTDKMPYNFMLLGLIACAIPSAKIIHCVRDPIETCYSIYKQNFSGSHAYTNELNELGHYYNCYRVMMDKWTQLFSDQIYIAGYESMVSDTELEIRRLLNNCGLEMEDPCLAFYKNKRAVRTASVAQVRKPIYKDALKASASVQEELKPLIEELSTYETI